MRCFPVLALAAFGCHSTAPVPLEQIAAAILRELRLPEEPSTGLDVFGSQDFDAESVWLRPGASPLLHLTIDGGTGSVTKAIVVGQSTPFEVLVIVKPLAAPTRSYWFTTTCSATRCDVVKRRVSTVQ